MGKLTTPERVSGGHSSHHDRSIKTQCYVRLTHQIRRAVGGPSIKKKTHYDENEMRKLTKFFKENTRLNELTNNSVFVK